MSSQILFEYRHYFFLILLFLASLWAIWFFILFRLFLANDFLQISGDSYLSAYSFTFKGREQ